MSECLNSIKNDLKNYNKNKALLTSPYFMNSENATIKEKFEKIKQNIDMIDFCLQLLSEEDREIIEMVYFKNLSIIQIGRLKCVCRNSIYYRLNNALEHLVDILK